MRIISSQDLENSPHLYQEIAEVLDNDGIVCFPSLSSYRLATKLLSQEAVIKFLQIKRRAKKGPTLILLPSHKMLQELVTEVSEPAQALIQKFWPGPLTLLFQLNPNLPQKILRNLNGDKAGIRVPLHPMTQQILKHFQQPILISSANIWRKPGANSEAQIRKNFGRWIDILISAGDIPPHGRSTIVDVTVNPPIVTRTGLIESQDILETCNSCHAIPSSITVPSAITQTTI